MLAGSNRLKLFVFADDAAGQVRLVAALDNLGKGASGAAVQATAASANTGSGSVAAATVTDPTNPVLTRTVVLAQVRSVLRADAVGERVVVVGLDPRHAPHIQEAERVRQVEDEEAELRPFEQVLHLLSGIA